MLQDKTAPGLCSSPSNFPSPEGGVRLAAFDFSDGGPSPATAWWACPLGHWVGKTVRGLVRAWPNGMGKVESWDRGQTPPRPPPFLFSRGSGMAPVR